MWIDQDKQEQQLLINYPEHFDRLTAEDIELYGKCPNLTSNDIAQVNELFDAYTFYRNTSAGRYTCFCTRCNHESTVNLNYDRYDTVPPKHNEEYCCDNCGSVTIAKAAGYAQKNLYSKKAVIIFKQTSDTVYAICLKVHKAYNGDDLGDKYKNSYWDNGSFKRMPDLTAEFEAMYILQKRRAIKLKNDITYHKGRWTRTLCKAKISWSQPFPTAGGIFAPQYAAVVNYINADIVDNSFLKYCGAFTAVCKEAFEPISYLAASAQYPIMEMVIKAGLIRYAKDLIYRNVKNYRICDWTADSPKHFFKKTTTQESKMFVKAAASPEVVAAYMTCRKSGKKKDLEYCQAYVQFCKPFNHTGFDGIAQFDPVVKYVKHQLRTYTANMSLIAGILEYRDYIRLAKNLKYNMDTQGTKYPRNLFKAHDAAVEIYNYQLAQQRAQRQREYAEAERREREQADKSYGGLYKKLCNFYKQFSFPGIELVVPASTEDIIAEGAALEHCVGSYALRHVKGELTILFIRKQDAKDQSWFTIEVRADQKTGEKYIVQCHGYKNEGRFCNNDYQKWDKPQIIKDFERAFDSFLKDPKRYVLQQSLKAG